MIHRRVVACCLLVPYLGAAACGDDGDPGDDTELRTGLPGDLLLRDLTAAQSNQVCATVVQSFDRRLSRETQAAGLCEMVHAVTSDDPAECRLESEMCQRQVLAGTSPTVSSDDFESTDELDCTSDAPRFQACSATVAELEACVDAWLGAIEAAFTPFSCDDAATIEEADLIGVDPNGTPPPPGCASFEAECALGP